MIGVAYVHFSSNYLTRGYLSQNNMVLLYEHNA